MLYLPAKHTWIEDTYILFCDISIVNSFKHHGIDNFGFFCIVSPMQPVLADYVYRDQLMCILTNSQDTHARLDLSGPLSFFIKVKG